MTAAALKPLEIPVLGMTCASCVGRVEKAIRAVPGVSAASVNLAAERASVSVDGPEAAAAVVEAIRSTGYEPLETATELSVTGMTCAGCVSKVQKALAGVPGVLDASVNLATGRATVRAVAGTTVEALIAAVRARGYDAAPVDLEGRVAADEEARRAEERRALARDTALAAGATLPLFLVEMARHFVPGAHHAIAAVAPDRIWAWISLALAAFVLFGPGLRFWKKGVPNLIRRTPDMNSLVVLGAGAAFAFSTVSTVAPGLLPTAGGALYFEAAAVIVTLILLGRWFEARAKGETSQAIRRLMSLQSRTARVERDGEAVETPIERVAPGDVIRLLPGERVAVDGVVLDGASWIDESMITGEPVPVEKTAGAAVTGGTVNTTGSLRYRALRVGSDTVLAQIVRMVESAQGAKLPVQALVDQVTGWFVPAVIVIAAVTFGVWLAFGPSPALSFALVNAVAVLIIACPCAMGLATPTSIMVGTGRAAELGVLFRKGEALQALRDVRVVAVDKTGTLTRGRPELTDLIVAEGEEGEVLALIAGVERGSEHPIARAIVTAAEARGLAAHAPEGFVSVPGYGAQARVAGRTVQVGAARYMTRLGLDASAFAETAARLAEDGKSPLYAAVDGRLAAVLAVADPIKESTPAAIAALHALGLKIAMISGDDRGAAEAVGRKLGIDTVIAEVLPEGKVEAVRALQADGAKVAFVGDGVNDAPALAAADVGLAVATGTDVAIESADVVLAGGDLRGVATAVGLGRATMRNIVQNLVWAFGYNVLLIPVAAGALWPAFGVLLSPMLAAGAMALSSVSVVTNALRLRRFRPVRV